MGYVFLNLIPTRQVVVEWPLTANRTLTWLGIGSDDRCVSQLVQPDTATLDEVRNSAQFLMLPDLT